VGLELVINLQFYDWRWIKPSPSHAVGLEPDAYFIVLLVFSLFVSPSHAGARNEAIKDSQLTS